MTAEFKERIAEFSAEIDAYYAKQASVTDPAEKEELRKELVRIKAEYDGLFWS